MNLNEPVDPEPRSTSPVFVPAQRLNLRSSDVIDGRNSDVIGESVIAPVRIQIHRWVITRSPDQSPARNDSQDSDATEEGVIAPVRIGNLQRLEFEQSPAYSESHDSDSTEDPTYSEGNLTISNVEGSAQASAVQGSESNDIAGNSSVPSVIIIRNNSLGLQEPGQGAGNSEADPSASEIQLTVEGRSNPENVVNILSFETGNPQGTLRVEVENVSNNAETSAILVHPATAGAGPSNQPDNDNVMDSETVPLIINYTGANLTNSPRQNVEGSSGQLQASPIVPAVVPQTENLDGASPPTLPIIVGTASTSELWERESRDGSPPPSKRQRLSSNSPPAPKQEAAPIVDDEDGLTCTICLDHWTSSGEHRLVSLKCGHLFGFSCIERWIKNQKPAERKCPTCKSKAKMTDVRNLYGHKIQMVDTTELEELRGKKNELEREKKDLMMEVGYMRKLNDDLQLKNREALMEIQKLKTEKMVSARPKRNEVSQHRYRAQVVQTLDLSKNEGCRVLAYNEVRSIIAASLPSPTNLFKEYALKLIDAESFRPRQTMPSHSRMIRDVAFSNDGKLLLSCSLDKTANVLCMDSNTSIATFQSEMPVWSVCWDADNPWVLFTGAQNGVIQQFDVRSPGQEISRIVTEGNPTPVASLAGIPGSAGVNWPQGGLLSCRFRQLYPYERTGSNSFETHPCSIDGAFTSLRFEKRTGHFLVSTRPTEKSPRAQHMFFQMSSVGKSPKFNLVQNFFGSTTLGVISRSCIIPLINPQCEVEDILVSSYVESESHIGLWSSSNGQKLQSIPSSETIMDLCPIYVNGKNYLSTLSDKRLRLYKIEKS